MRDYTEFSQFATECFSLKQNKIGLLGGTFNPVHNGHLKMASIALDEFLLGEVVFLPLGAAPHKQNQSIATVEERLDMLKLAVASEPRFSVNPIEINRGGLTYTVDTLETLTQLDSNAEYYFIIGADTLFELCTWKNFRRVITLTNFICILRPGSSDQKVKEYAGILNEKYGEKIYVSCECGPSISSSDIRRKCETDGCPEGLLPKSVAYYISSNRIYTSRGLDE